MKTSVVLFFIFCCFVGPAQAIKSESASGEISSVIVYRGQALVTRTIELGGQEGDVELIVGPLPEKIVPESLYSQAPENINVLSVRYREKDVGKDTRAEVQEVEKQIEEVSRSIRYAELDLTYTGKQWNMFVGLKDFTISMVKADLSKGLLVFEPLQKLTELIETKGEEYHEKTTKLRKEIEDSKKQLELLNQKKNRLTAGRSRTERQAVVFLNKSDNKPATMELSYLVNGADWSPQYNLRAQPDKSTATIEYNAVLHQSSGENWDNALLALSTAQPTLVASPPALEPMEITLRKASEKYDSRVLFDAMPMDARMQMPQEEYEYIDQTQQFEQLMQSRRSVEKMGKQAQIALNEFADKNQMLEFQADKQTLKRMNRQMAAIRRTEGVSVMYKLAGRLSLPSRSDQQLVTITTIQSKADFMLLAMPLLTDYIYLQAEVYNESDTILLPGPAAMYRNGEFVGKGDMGLVTIGQKFTTGFGVDSQIQVTREFKNKKIETLWGNRFDQHEYTIEINNYKNSAVKLCLLERLPYTENPEIEIKLTDPSHPLSTNVDYVRTQKDKGMLRWDLELGANTTGEKATVLTYGFSLKYDNDMEIRTVAKK
jgi:hypothetical protein